MFTFSLPALFSLLLLYVLLSEWLLLPFGLLQGPLIRGEIIFFTVLLFALWNYRKITITIIGALLLIAFPFWFLGDADGRLLFSDDNPTFLYRLLLLKEHFPSIPFYNPLWNSGIDARDFFATGTLNFFLLFSPLIYLLDLVENYNFLVALLLFGVVPLSTASGAYILGIRGVGALIAALLSLSSSLFWYRWALQFGTLGFITSAALLPLVLSLGVKFFEEKQVSLGGALLTAAVVSLTLFWSPAGLVCIPIIFLGLFYLPHLLKQRWWLPTIALLTALHLPWISLFWSVSNVGTFLDSEQKVSTYADTHATEFKAEEEKEEKKVFKHKTEEVSLGGIYKNIKETIHSSQPLLWILLIPGTLLLPRAGRLVFGLTFLWLLSLGGAGPLIKPQLEFDRMLVILTLISALPTSLAITHLIGKEGNRFLGSLAIGFLFAGTLSAGSIIKSRSVVPIYYESDEVEKIVQATKKYTGDGRILFSGFMLHEFSGGHLAPLPLFSGKPVIASSPVHNLWRYKQVFPKKYLAKKETGIQEYLDLHNVSAVFAHERKWREYFRTQEENYTEVEQIGSFSLFTRTTFPDTYFLSGEGEVTSQSTSEVHFTLKSDEAILKFQWFPFVRVEGCTVSPHRISKDITFVRVSECEKKKSYILKSVTPYERWAMTYTPPKENKKEENS